MNIWCGSYCIALYTEHARSSYTTSIAKLDGFQLVGGHYRKKIFFKLKKIFFSMLKVVIPRY